MNVLIPLPFDVSNLAHGRNLRVVHLLRELHQQIELLVVVPTAERLAKLAKVLPNVPAICSACSLCPDGCWSETTSWPLELLPMPRWQQRLLGYFGVDPYLVRETARRAPQHDAILGFDVGSIPSLLAARRSAAADRVRVVCDLIDDPWLSWGSTPATERASLFGLKQALAVAALRRWVMPAMDALIAVAPRDATSLAQACQKPVAVLPNGVHLPDRAELSMMREPLVVFTGAMQFPPNERAACWLAERVWPRVLRGFAGTSMSEEADGRPRLAIVGTSPSPRVQRLARQPGVTVTGEVPNVGDWLRRARVAVAPMRSGSGIKNKVLEACAMACPVVATPYGAAGLRPGPDRGLLVRNTAATFAEAVVKLLQDPSRAAQLGLRARGMVAQQYAWSQVTAHLLGILREGVRITPTALRDRQVAVPSHRQRSKVHVPNRGKEGSIHAAS